MGNIEQYSAYRNKMRSLVNSVYDMQKLRIATGNRLVASLYGESADAVGEEVDGSRLRPILTDYQRITDYYAQQASKRPRITTVLNEVGSKLQVIKTQLDFDMASTYFDLCRAEERQLKAVKREVQETPIGRTSSRTLRGVVL